MAASLGRRTATRWHAERCRAGVTVETRIEDPTVMIEDRTAVGVRLNTEIKNHGLKVAKNQEALDKATAIREKQLAEFNAKVSRSHVPSVATTLQPELRKPSPLLEGVFSHPERRAVASLVQAPDDYFDAAPSFMQSCAPPSCGIFGSLRLMKETFESNLSLPPPTRRARRPRQTWKTQRRHSLRIVNSC